MASRHAGGSSGGVPPHHNHHNPSNSNSPMIPSSNHPFSSQNAYSQEILTQNPELTQLGDDDDDEGCGSQLSLLSSPKSPARNRPWGRLVPCAGPATGVDLLPRLAHNSNNNAAPAVPSHHLLHVYALGRSQKCDVVPLKRRGLEKKEQARHDWAYGMISNKHCQIYCTRDDVSDAQAPLAVYVEDLSGNGTVVNKSVLLRKGQKRLLHTGDEICLVNPQTVAKKIRSKTALQSLLQHYSYIFVKDQQHQHQSSQLLRNTGNHTILPLLPTTSTSSSKRKTAVNVRATKPHLWERPTPRNLQATSPPPPPSDNAKRRVEEDYDIRDVLGSGTVGQVRRAIHRQTGKEYAVKIIHVPPVSRFLGPQSVSTAAVEAEALILRQLNHPYIVKLYDVYVSTSTNNGMATGTGTANAGSSVYLIMELLAGGDLFDRIVLRGKYTEANARRLTRRLLAAIFHLHVHLNLVHRDIKPENIMLSSRNCDVHIKLTDFGLAKKDVNNSCKTFCGTPQYFAPEVWKRGQTVFGRGAYGKPADIWSVGVVLYILLTGVPPFQDAATVECPVPYPAEHWKEVSPQAQDLVRRLLVTDPRQRLTVQEACQHEWILQNPDLEDTHGDPLQDPLILEAQQQEEQDAEEDERSKLAANAQEETPRKSRVEEALASTTTASTLQPLSNAPTASADSILTVVRTEKKRKRRVTESVGSAAAAAAADALDENEPVPKSRKEETSCP